MSRYSSCCVLHLQLSMSYVYVCHIHSMLCVLDQGNAMLHLSLHKCRFDDRGFDDRTMEANYKQIQVIDVLICLNAQSCMHCKTPVPLQCSSQHMP